MWLLLVDYSLLSSPGSFPLTFQAYYTSSQMSSPFCAVAFLFCLAGHVAVTPIITPINCLLVISFLLVIYAVDGNMASSCLLVSQPRC
jgi:hypothetical protein